MNNRRLISFFLSLLLATLMYAQHTDSIRVSLITCSPGQEIYSLYGHTAIRCQNFDKGVDVAFNYGVFSFDQPDFMWRFVRGKCDYIVMSVPWNYFLREYEDRGSSVVAQVLNLNREESNKIYDALVQNSRPENCEYRYNFLYNNCTTMVRNMIERCVDGRVQYPDSIPLGTYREMLHEYTAQHPWAQEGNDILLGASVDTVLSARAAMFAPDYMRRYAEGAFICSVENNMKPLVKSTEIILQKKNNSMPDEFPLSPEEMAGLCFLVFLALMLFERCVNWMFWFGDMLLLLVQGLAGVLLTFMFFFSEHPAVDSNWQIWVLNPLALVGIPYVVKSAWMRKKTLWHALYFVILTLFMVFSPWIPQDFGKLVVPLTLCLLTRPISYYLYYRKNKI